MFIAQRRARRKISPIEHLQLLENNPFSKHMSNWDEISGGYQLPSYRMVAEQQTEGLEGQYLSYNQEVKKLHSVPEELAITIINKSLALAPQQTPLNYNCCRDQVYIKSSKHYARKLSRKDYYGDYICVAQMPHFDFPHPLCYVVGIPYLSYL